MNTPFVSFTDHDENQHLEPLKGIEIDPVRNPMDASIIPDKFRYYVNGYEIDFAIDMDEMMNMIASGSKVIIIRNPNA